MTRRLLAIWCLLLALPACAQSVTLAWDASTYPSGLCAEGPVPINYRIYHRYTNGEYTSDDMREAGAELTLTWTGLQTRIAHLFVAQAKLNCNTDCYTYPDAGTCPGTWQVSPYSNEVTATIPEPLSRCDLNGDGAVNVLDLQRLILSIQGQIPDTADINMDGNTNVLDLQVLVNVILGRITCPEP